MDTLTISIAVGLIVSLLFTERFGLSSGGMIVPGYRGSQDQRRTQAPSARGGRRPTKRG